MGLSDEAKRYLEKNAERSPVTECPTCHHKEGGEMIRSEYASAAHLGMFDDGPPLFEYVLKNGKKAREVIQGVPWNSGPCIYLCLEVDGVKTCQWD